MSGVWAWVSWVLFLGSHWTRRVLTGAVVSSRFSVRPAKLIPVVGRTRFLADSETSLLPAWGPTIPWNWSSLLNPVSSWQVGGGRESGRIRWGVSVGQPWKGNIWYITSAVFLWPEVTAKLNCKEGWDRWSNYLPEGRAIESGKNSPVSAKSPECLWCDFHKKRKYICLL